VYKVWDLATGADLPHGEQEYDPAEHDLATIISPDGTKKASLSAGGTTTISVAPFGAVDDMADSATASVSFPTHDWGLHGFTVGSAAFSEDGSKFMVGSHDNTISVYDVCTGVLVDLLGNQVKHHVDSVKLSPDGRKALLLAEDGTLHVWEITH
jgi:WD40 repeat protein